MTDNIPYQFGICHTYNPFWDILTKSTVAYLPIAYVFLLVFSYEVDWMTWLNFLELAMYMGLVDWK